MGFFSALSNMAGKEALSMINDFRRGKAGSTSVKRAFELLASSGSLYKRADADSDNVRYYYFDNNRRFENIFGDTEEFSSSRFIKVRKSECSYIDFSGCY